MQRKNGGYFERRAAIGRTNTPHHSYTRRSKEAPACVRDVVLMNTPHHSYTRRSKEAPACVRDVVLMNTPHHSYTRRSKEAPAYVMLF